MHHVAISLTLAGSGEPPFAEKTSPKKVSEFLWSSHFSGEIVSPELANCCGGLRVGLDHALVWSFQAQ